MIIVHQQPFIHLQLHNHQEQESYRIKINAHCCYSLGRIFHFSLGQLGFMNELSNLLQFRTLGVPNTKYIILEQRGEKSVEEGGGEKVCIMV